MRGEIGQLLFLIDTAYDHVSWHGTNLRGSLRGVTPKQAAWRPGPRRHNIWEIVVHAAYWKYVAWRRLTGAERGSFAEVGSNWFSRPEQMSLDAWKADVEMLAETHRALRDIVAAIEARDLDRTMAKASRTTRRALITGIAAHDIYHAGQIQLLKRLGRRG
ncbi:MAG TPA: DinB family protein [Vicinamibacterales bacterium]|nr:DinB family protein [Vicinamibacterales bacterium]